MYFFVYGLMFCFGNTNEKGDNNMCKILNEIGGLTAYELLEKYSISLSPPIDIKKLVDNKGYVWFAMIFLRLKRLAIIHRIVSSVRRCPKKTLLISYMRLK